MIFIQNKRLPLLRAGVLLFALLVLLTSCSNIARSKSWQLGIKPDGISSNKHMNIRLLGSLGLSTAHVNGLPIVELSGIAWDKDEQKLYAVSDEGYLYTFQLNTKGNVLRSAKVLSATRLKDKNNQPLQGRYIDSEGLDLRNASNGRKGDTELVISFEVSPRIQRYTTRGRYISNIALPGLLTNIKSYRHRNKSLESVSSHPKYGWITAAEQPLRRQPAKLQTLYSSRGQQWSFRANKAPKSSVTGLEVLSNGDVLVLERAWSGFLSPLVISLKQVHLNQCDKRRICKTRQLAEFSSADGWFVDNFEGLAHIEGNRYLMVSDDNKSPLQQALMVMFEVLP